MKKLIYVLLLLFLFLFILIGCPTASIILRWDAPLTTSNSYEACVSSLNQINKPIFYTVKWRIKDQGILWENANTVETETTSVQITNLKYNTTYELISGAHYEHQLVYCWSDIFTFTTPSN